MSLEAALEEERLEILKLLERPAGTKSPPPPSGGRSYGPGSPLGSRTTSPTRGKVTTSLIDIAAPSAGFASKKSPNTSPTLKFSSPVVGGSSSNGLYRSRHDSGLGAPRLLRDIDKPEIAGFNPEDTYQFAMNNSIIPPLPPAPKRVSAKQPIRSMLGGAAGDDRFSSIGSRRSSSPATNAAYRHATRNGSPRRGTDSARSSTGRLASPAPDARAYSIGSDDGALPDLQHAYRALNDQALASSGGVLQNLPQKKDVLTINGEHIRAGSGESLTRGGGVRLQKDYGGENAIADSSDDDSTDDGETTSGEGKSEDEEGRRRGRSREKARGSLDGDVDLAQKIDGSLEPSTTKRIGSLLNVGGPSSSRKSASASKGGARKTMSQLAAAEEERKLVSSKNKVRSLLPSISVTQAGNSAASGPSSPITYRKPGVHPATNFDVASRTSTPMSSDTEMDLAELRRAQQMEMNLSQITSTPETNRVVRTIIRGDYDILQREAEEGKRRQRTYLVATDMSAEAAHALEWTIGTVLRDGDTLLAIYAIDEDNVDTNATPPSASTLNGVIDGSGDGRSTPTLGTYPTASTNSLSMLSNVMSAHSAPSSPLVSFSTPPSRTSTPPPGSRRGSGEKNRRGISRDGGQRNLIGERSKAELERIVAVENVTQLVTKLLKKTRLQVRCVVEVIHCKSPKHLLTEMIDYIEPTLVILGSRGRSALKGVLLGSFSNYLVTKSSVPVMVARKKLKQHTKQKKKGNVFAHGTNSSGPVNVRLANNLLGSLARAKVD